MAASMGPALAAAVDRNDAEGMAARESMAEFANKLAELDALLQDSDDESCVARRRAAPEPESLWQLRKVGLEIQTPWSRMLLSGSKTIETRRYPLPAALLGRPISVLETDEGQARISGLPDEVPAGDAAVRLAGTVTFGSCVEYSSLAEWLRDECRHCVPSDSPYAWTSDQVVFGWVVEAAAPFDKPGQAPVLRRRHRSLFELEPEDFDDDSHTTQLEKKMRCGMSVSEVSS
eukprot:TRINITY_DN84398_c0_g1_i1.p1 TRINITY_DN84398_c0_g1~~TRINITY_DN84398_c0_g1_i1.p1  ORF type:complete len:265 (-),score=38.76 TRINITY_DN84398_c0_g1_i1:65-760(-)